MLISLVIKKLTSIVTELFIRGRHLNISLASITSYYFIMNIPNKIELQQITFNHSSDIDFQDIMNLYMNLYKKCTAKPYSFLVIDATMGSNNSLRFRKNLVEKI